MTTTLHLGRYQDTLADVTCDTLITDCPYSARTHGGHDGAPTVARNGGTHGKHRHSPRAAGTYSCDPIIAQRRGLAPVERRAIDYAGWTPEVVHDFAAFFSGRVRGWWVSITDHVLAPVWADAMASTGLYVFAPLPWYAPGSRVRLAGDGPSSWTCWIIVGRPRVAPFTKWGTLPGGYAIPSDRRSLVVGAKPLALMRALARHYSCPGDVICDPCAGGGTTLRAAQLEGRHGIGSEMDPETHAKATERLAQPFTPPLLVDAPAPEQMTIGDQ